MKRTILVLIAATLGLATLLALPQAGPKPVKVTAGVTPPPVPGDVRLERQAQAARESAEQQERDAQAALQAMQTTTTTLPPTTTHTHPPTTTTTVAPAPPAPRGDRLRSTAYCLTGNMASGKPTYVGAVAANRYPLGTILQVWPNPWGDPNMRFTVEDRHERSDSNGYPTQLDFAMPRECDRALEWGNKNFVEARIVG